MQALRRHASSDLRLAEFPITEPAATHDVLIGVAGCEVCGIDPHELSGHVTGVGRNFEQRTSKLYAAGEIPGFVHLPIGQQAATVGACRPLRSTDGIASNHRKHDPASPKAWTPTATAVRVLIAVLIATVYPMIPKPAAAQPLLLVR